MDEILIYVQYDYLLCFDVDWDDNLNITGSSIRAISERELLNVNNKASIKDLPLFKYSAIFSEYFKLQPKEKDQLSESENATLASIRDLFKRIKQHFSEKDGISLKTAQILFIMPLGWTKKQYKDKLRGFFLDMDWITPKDNESKLIMIPLIQVLADSFQNSSKQEQRLDRERTSVLFSVQPANNEDEKTEFSYTFFKMQSAKELIAVSKTLASSDFLLVPSIGSSKSIYLANLRNLMYNAVKIILTHIQGKDPECTSKEDTAKKDDPAWQIACNLPSIQKKMLEWDYNKSLEEAFKGIDFDNHQLQDLKSWPCDQLIAAVLEDVNVKHYLKQVSNFYKEALDEFGAARNSPDGIQHVLLYCHFRYQNVESDFSGDDLAYYIEHKLKDENLVQPDKGVLRILKPYSAQLNAMQQPYKMIQIANAILPPVIVNDKEQNDFTFQASKYADSLIAPNSFYVQANVTETQISFILNKVIDAPSSKNAIELFTIQERSIEIEYIAETVSHMLWNHYQYMADLEEQQHALFKCCQNHNATAFLSSHYKKFKENAKKLIDLWFETKEAFYGEELDTYHLVLVDQRCTCALKLSQRLLLEVGLKPAIANIATTIMGALFSNDFFGLYQLSALILEKNMKTINNFRLSCAIDRLLKQALEGFLRVHHNRLLLLFHDEQASDNVSQYLGRGGYSQVLSKTYTFRFIYWSQSAEDFLGLLEFGACKRFPITGSGKEIIEFTYPGLVKGADLPLDGINLTFLVKDCRYLSLAVYESDTSEGGTSQHQLGPMYLENGLASTMLLCSPISVKILPEHYSSTIKFNISRSLVSSINPVTVFRLGKPSQSGIEHYVDEKEETANVHERLYLKKKLP